MSLYFALNQKIIYQGKCQVSATDKENCVKAHEAINLGELYLPFDLKYKDTCVYVCVCVCVRVYVCVYTLILSPFHGIPHSVKSTLTW